MTFQEQMQADLENVFVAADEFEVTATYRPTAGGSFSLPVYFDKIVEETETEGAPIINGIPMVATPTHLLLAIAAPVPVKTDELDVAGKTYKIRNYLPDGTGLTTLLLYEDD